jgi:hypothetical protein
MPVFSALGCIVKLPGLVLLIEVITLKMHCKAVNTRWNRTWQFGLNFKRLKLAKKHKRFVKTGRIKDS